MGVNSLPKTVTRQRCGRDLNPGPSANHSATEPPRTALRTRYANRLNPENSGGVRNVPLPTRQFCCNPRTISSVYTALCVDTRCVPRRAVVRDSNSIPFSSTLLKAKGPKTAAKLAAKCVPHRDAIHLTQRSRVLLSAVTLSNSVPLSPSSIYRVM